MPSRSRGAGLLALIAALLLLPTGGTSQQVQGILRDVNTDAPLPFGTVELLDAEGMLRGWTICQDDGTFVLVAPGPGTYHLRGSHLGAFPLVDGPVQLAYGEIASFDFYLQPRSIELDPLLVEVTPQTMRLRAQGFYERAQTGFGVFVTPQAIAQRNPMMVSDLLVTMPGVRLYDGDMPGHRFAMFRSGETMLGAGSPLPCLPRISIDGVILQQGGPTNPADALDMDRQVHARDILAMEVYRSPAETPAKYSGGYSICGVIVIWTGRQAR